jgi:hypothetical protein
MHEAGLSGASITTSTITITTTITTTTIILVRNSSTCATGVYSIALLSCTVVARG